MMGLPWQRHTPPQPAPDDVAAAVRRVLKLADDVSVYSTTTQTVSVLHELIAVAAPMKDGEHVQFAETPQVWVTWVGTDAVVRVGKGRVPYVLLDAEAGNGWTRATPVLVVARPPTADTVESGWHVIPFTDEPFAQADKLTADMYTTYVQLHDPLRPPSAS